MKIGFYPRLALDGICKNRRLYLPYLLTCVLVVSVCYILNYLARCPILPKMEGGYTLQTALMLGSNVMAIFSLIFLFYTNSFLIRRRKKEFGLYNILGMGKGSIGHVMLWESVLICCASLAAGLTVGIGLSKLVELGLTNLVGGEVRLDFTVSFVSVRNTVVLFCIIFGLIFLHVLRQVGFSSPMALFRSESVGEKPPKANWLLGIAGVVLLGIAYYMSVSIQKPLAALTLFFVAVVLVIIATYLLMISGSVLLCRILQKNKNYYCKPNHFVSVSSMVYRMKRNGAGLASICILLTMVLVMISSSACLYFGAEDSLRSRYPYDFSVSVGFEDLEEMDESATVGVRANIEQLLKDRGIEAEETAEYTDVTVYGTLENGVFSCASDTWESQFNNDNAVIIYFMGLSDYNAIYGGQEQLAPGEALLCAKNGTKIPESLTFGETQLRVVGRVKEAPLPDAMGDVIPYIHLIVPDVQAVAAALPELASGVEENRISMEWHYRFNTHLSITENIAFRTDVLEAMKQELDYGVDRFGYYSLYCLDAMRGDFYATYGGLFFIGIVLSIVFLVAAVLMIYYKQISEGYEDQSRFEIMQKVGMSREDIRRSINSQLLTVFSLPPLFAVLHLSFAFPMVRKVLTLFAVTNLSTLLVTTAVSVLLFGLFYAAVYWVTSNVYYSIVSGGREK